MGRVSPLEERIGREAYEYGYAQARRLRDLGCEPTLARGLPFLLWAGFEPGHDPQRDALEAFRGEWEIVAEEVYPENFARGFLDEAVHLEGPLDPRERCRAFYLICAALPDAPFDPTRDGAELRALLEGPHARWAARELTLCLREGRRFGDPPTDMPGYRPGGRSRAPRAWEGGPPLRVEAFANRNPASGLDGYSIGDELELCYAAERADLVGLSPEGIARTVFLELNSRDHEGSGPSPLRSLCIGDVVSCREGARGPAGSVNGPADGPAPWSLAVEVRGFAPVSPPVFAPDPEHAAHRRKADR